MNNLIGISGKIHSGKDTVGKIIQTLATFPEMSNERILVHLDKDLDGNNYQLKKFADKLKEMVCILIGCTRVQLEDHDFKNKPLGSEWNFWRLKLTIRNQTGGQRDEDKIFLSREQCHEYYSRDKNEFGGNAGMRMFIDNAFEEVQMTPRLLLQLLGTDCGREIIHPNIWVNATFSDYHAYHIDDGSRHGKHKFPNWILTDMRFPNELNAVKERDGFTIRVNRFDGLTAGQIGVKEHESETALDNSNFDYVIDNDGSLQDLTDKVRAILIMEKSYHD